MRDCIPRHPPAPADPPLDTQSVRDCSMVELALHGRDAWARARGEGIYLIYGSWGCK